ncbi:hypothetical protein IEQ34_001864 [Dendrobium chrysotoxum]|uniref:Uncharacterized protein n=1 Tax=Dendrobium chrysotoxum TaxID=161865 RepID=A0AAV7HLB1_DENCH|nr:hypothetical protein IEQ34_001864 [Dendrobium chrysotoxum]
MVLSLVKTGTTIIKLSHLAIQYEDSLLTFVFLACVVSSLWTSKCAESSLVSNSSLLAANPAEVALSSSPFLSNRNMSLLSIVGHDVMGKTTLSCNMFMKMK